MKNIKFLLPFIFLTSCGPGPEKAIQVLDDAGYSNISITDSSNFAQWNGCSKGDSIAHTATATNVKGKRVNLVVCCGLMKSCTIRQ